MKHLFQIREQNKSPNMSSRMQDLEEELKYANETILSLRQRLSEADSSEIKSKLRIMTTKFGNIRKERDNLKKENRAFSNEVLSLQCNMRQMIPGYSNTSISFPLQNEITDKTSQFWKCDCQDLFFETLGPELSIEGVIYFFKNCYTRLTGLVRNYFQGPEESLQSISALDSLEGPVLNVLRKTYQANWRKVLSRCLTVPHIATLVDDIQRVLRLGGSSEAMSSHLHEFLIHLGELLLVMAISDPPLYCKSEYIGQEIEFNNLLHEAIDGFIRPGDKCLIVLPPLQRATGDTSVRAGVLHVHYEINF